MPDQVAPNNKLVVFRGRAERERARLPRAVRGNGLVSDSALRRFQKRAGNNPPKPEFAETDVIPLPRPRPQSAPPPPPAADADLRPRFPSDTRETPDASFAGPGWQYGADMDKWFGAGSLSRLLAILGTRPASALGYDPFKPPADYHRLYQPDVVEYGSGYAPMKPPAIPY